MITLASGKSIDVSPTLLMQMVRSALKVKGNNKVVSIKMHKEKDTESSASSAMQLTR